MSTTQKPRHSSEVAGTLGLGLGSKQCPSWPMLLRSKGTKGYSFCIPQFSHCYVKAGLAGSEHGLHCLNSTCTAGGQELPLIGIGPGCGPRCTKLLFVVSQKASTCFTITSALNPAAHQSRHHRHRSRQAVRDHSKAQRGEARSSCSSYKLHQISKHCILCF